MENAQKGIDHNGGIISNIHMDASMGNYKVIIQKIDFRKLKYKTVIWLVLFSFLSVATLLGYSIGIFYYILGIIGSVATIIIAAPKMKF